MSDTECGCAVGIGFNDLSPSVDDSNCKYAKLKASHAAEIAKAVAKERERCEGEVVALGPGLFPLDCSAQYALELAVKKIRGRK